MPPTEANTPTTNLEAALDGALVSILTRASSPTVHFDHVAISADAVLKLAQTRALVAQPGRRHDDTTGAVSAAQAVLVEAIQEREQALAQTERRSQDARSVADLAADVRKGDAAIRGALKVLVAAVTAMPPGALL